MRFKFIPAFVSLLTFMAFSWISIEGRFVVIEDFEGYAPDTMGEVPLETFAYLSLDKTAPTFFIYEDPLDEGNSVFFCDANTFRTGDFNTLIHFPIPEELRISPWSEDAVNGTIYFRIFVYGYSNNWSLMLSDHAMLPSGYYASVGKSYANRGVLEASNGIRSISEYTLSDPEYALEIEVWHEIWIELFRGRFRVYVKRSDELNRKLLSFGDLGADLVISQLVISPEYPFESIVIGTNEYSASNPQENDKWLIDDIMLEVRPAEWCNYALVERYNVDTGSWLGWLWVESEPWVYSWSLQSWAYIDNCPTTDGGWVYLSK